VWILVRERLVLVVWYEPIFRVGRVVVLTLGLVFVKIIEFVWKPSRVCILGYISWEKVWIRLCYIFIWCGQCDKGIYS
jgi:hypothetical protein